METSLNVWDYPEPNEEITHTMKVDCHFTTYITVYGDDEEDWERQVYDFVKEEKYDLLDNVDCVEIDEYQKI